MPRFLKIAGNTFNFTTTCNSEISGDWGAIPKTGGWYDQNATFGGILGRVISGEFDIAASAWFHNHQRFEWLDFPFRYKVSTYQVRGTKSTSVKSPRAEP